MAAFSIASITSTHAAPAFVHFHPLFLLPMSRNPFTPLLRFLFFAVAVRAVILVGARPTPRHRQRLPQEGPAVLAGNHNSNLDALAIMSLMPLRPSPKLLTGGRDGLFLHQQTARLVRQQHRRHHPGEARQRQGGRQPAPARRGGADCCELPAPFPEGTRGEPETLQAFKRHRPSRACAAEGAGVSRLHAWARQGAARGARCCWCRSTSRSISASRSTARTAMRSSSRKLERAMTALAAEEKLPAWE